MVLNCGIICILHLPVTFNPLSPSSDQYQISPCNINAQSNREAMRIENMITQDKNLLIF